MSPSEKPRQLSITKFLRTTGFCKFYHASIDGPAGPAWLRILRIRLSSTTQFLPASMDMVGIGRRQHLRSTRVVAVFNNREGYLAIDHESVRKAVPDANLDKPFVPN